MQEFPQKGRRAMKVGIFDLKFDETYKAKFAIGVGDILNTGFVSEGKFTKEFEIMFANFVKAKHAVCTTSGTGALEIALKAIGVEGKEVIVPSNTFFATAVAVRNAGGILKLVDMEDETFAICPESLKATITKDTRAVVIVHIGGVVSKHIEEIVNICKENDIELIEDAAHAHGSARGEFVAGTIGSIGCFSFFPTKVMTTGEGGMITTNNEELANRCRSLKNFGRDLQDAGLCVSDFGNNFKVSEFTSLMGVLELERVRDRIGRRKHLAKLYKDNLGDKYDVFFDDSRNSFYKVIVRTPKKQDHYKAYCKDNNISLTGEVYRIPIHKQPLYSYQFGLFPVTDYFCERHICPPLYPELTDEQVLYTCEILRRRHED